MIALIVLVPLQVAFATCFFLYRKRKKTCALLLAAAFLIVCCPIGLVVYDLLYNDSPRLYSYEISIDSEKLESLCIDFDTPQQYEEWFSPDKHIETFDEPIMRKKIVLANPHGEVFVDLICYEDLYAMTGYARIVNDWRPIPYSSTTEISADYEYAIGDAYAYKKYNGFWFARDGEYASDVAIRYKKVVFEFTEYTNEERKSRIGEAIDLLWADYERYKEEMSLP